MQVAILSGKGGAGKTLVAVNLAAAAGQASYIDCDVEEPNGHLFFKPQGVQEEDISVKIPEVIPELCEGSRKCVDFCNFNALAYINKKLMVFEEVCHSCGGCILVCPQKALTEKERVIGTVQRGISDQAAVFTGRLNTGEASGTPIIKNLLTEDVLARNQETFIDCPPGTACIVMESIKDADYCILVAEPTVFGVHNLNMVYELVKLFDKPFGVVLNKCLQDENPAEEFCLDKQIKILGRIPFDTQLGMLNSNAQIAVREDERYRDMFTELLEAVRMEVQHETTVNPER